MHTEIVEYHEQDTAFTGFLARPEGAGPHPCVLVCHAFAGRTEDYDQIARDLAALGYVGFAMDVYGAGVIAEDRAACVGMMMPLVKDRPLLRRRLSAGMMAARTHDAVDPSRMAAIGYCFGGLCALDLARMGAPLRGVVSFHGNLRPAEGLDNDVRAKVLVCHDDADPMVTPEQVAAFREEMTEAGADWQLHVYGGAMHSFTNPRANDPDFGTVYQEAAHRRSWALMRSFLDECFED